MLAAVLVAGASGQQATQGDRQYQAALHKEMVERDLKGAIEEYKKIAKGTDKPLAAKALLRMAECYQKLGDAEATKIYEQLVRDFGGQPEAAEARARLSAMGAKSTPGVSDRSIWQIPVNWDLIGPISANGRFAVIDHLGNPPGIFLHDFRTGSDRMVVAPATKLGMDYGVGDVAVISRDAQQLAYFWLNSADGLRVELRTTDLTSGAVAQPRVLFSAPTTEDVSRILPVDWTPDGRSILTQVNRDDGTVQIALMPVSGGQLQVLKSIGWRVASNVRLQMRVSPDGRSVAYDVPGANTNERDIFVLQLDGASELPAVHGRGNDRVLGWARDGRLVFMSDRSGSERLFTVRLAAGKAELPVASTTEINSCSPVGFTQDGSLYCEGGGPNTNAIRVAAIDFNTGKVPSAPADLASVGSYPHPRWSHDGQWIAYTASGVNRQLVIRSATSGAEHRLRMSGLRYMDNPQWTPDDRFILVDASDFDGRDGIYRIDVQAGTTSLLARSALQLPVASSWSGDKTRVRYLRDEEGSSGTVRLMEQDIRSGKESVLYVLQDSSSVRPPGWHFAISPDGTKTYERTVATPDRPGSVLERDLASGTMRTVIAKAGLGRNLTVSPDGQWLSVAGPDLLIVSLTGDAQKTLMTGDIQLQAWAPDSRSLLVRKRSSNQGGPSSQVVDFFWLPIDGREPVEIKEFKGLNTATKRGDQMWVHPDGRRLLFNAVETTGSSSVLRVIQNVLPPANTKK